MHRRLLHLVVSLVATWIVLPAAIGEIHPASPDPAELLHQLHQEIEALPESPPGLLARLEDLQQAIDHLTADRQEARRAEAIAYARMASWTGAILSRELKKVDASSRLIQITEQTGRTEEVARYRERHQRLLDTITNTAAHYESIVRHLGTLDATLVAAGFDAYQAQLIGEELASQLAVHRVVRRQVENYRQTGTTDVTAWQKELHSR